MRTASLLRRWIAALAVTLVVMAVPFDTVVVAHQERDVEFAARGRGVPSYRTEGPRLVVCTDETSTLIERLDEPFRSDNVALLGECGFEKIQAAIDAVTERGTRILVMPGVYREPSSTAQPSGTCMELAQPEQGADAHLSYEQQLECPHARNVIAILGDGLDPDMECDGPLCDLQLEGTGASPGDVVIDGAFSREDVIRADRADGIYLRNFTVQHARASALYVIETDGFAIDGVVSRWNSAYGFLSYASDDGIYRDCEAYGNGDSGLYPGGGARTHEGFSIEVTGCRSHDNLMGLAGTGGNYLHIHDNDFSNNSVGLALDSMFPDHPGLPQHESLIENNRIFENNADFYRHWRSGRCLARVEDRGYDEGVVCPQFLIPMGTGILIAGGNDNSIRSNEIYGNDRYGVMLTHNPTLLLRMTDQALATSFRNRFIDNTMNGRRRTDDNGLADFWWDGGGCGKLLGAERREGGAPNRPYTASEVLGS